MSRLHSPPEALAELAAATAGSVLLQSGGQRGSAGRTFLFEEPEAVLSAGGLADVGPMFDAIDEACRRGLYAAGYVSYEAGHAFEPRLRGLRAETGCGMPLAWFGLYREPIFFDHRSGSFLSGASRLPFDAGQEHDRARPVELAGRQPASLAMGFEAYAGCVAEIKTLIEAGETYQVNFTTKVAWRSALSPAALFRHMVATQPVEFAALLNLGETQILSASPELFFQRNGRRITMRPMKGTAPRGFSVAEDRERAEWLARDEKNRSENVMIVDLLRNDLGRICEMGSVAVEELFEVERLSTLLQMTSTVSGRLRAKTGSRAVFEALFPSGSITGAPKLHTMELIDTIEREARGVYTGAIGFFSPKREAVFSVAIRTVVMKGDEAVMGVGSGIVYDSDAASEYEECRLKTSFLERSAEPFELIETLLWESGYRYLNEHLERLARSAEYFDFDCSTKDLCEALLQIATMFALDERRRVRLTVASDGRATITHRAVSAVDSPVTARMAAERTASGDLFLRHKTTRRRVYDAALVAAQAGGYADALFLNERGELTEGAIHTVFLVKDGVWRTPPLSSGVLPGVLREHVLGTRTEVVEAVLTVEDLRAADAVFLGNSVRGLCAVERIDGAEVGRPLVWRAGA